MSNMYDKTKFFNSYFSRATEKTLVVETLGTRLNRNIKNILDLGCHNGTLMRLLTERYKPIISEMVNIIGIDPSPVAIDEFLLNDFAKEYSVQGYVAKAEDYLAMEQKSFDLIIASQCLYWSPNLDNIIRRIHDQSQSALIVLRGNKGIYEIQSTFKDLLGNQEEKLYTADDIEKSLISQNIAFNKESYTTYIDLPFEDDEVFNSMIAFFLQVYDINMPPKQLATIKKFILDKSENSRLRHDIALFWLGKAQIQ